MCGRHGVGVGGGCVEDREYGREEDVWKTESGGGRVEDSGGRRRVCGRQRNGERRRLSGRQVVEKVEDREWGREEEAEWKTGSGEGGRQGMGNGGGG